MFTEFTGLLDLIS